MQPETLVWFERWLAATQELLARLQAQPPALWFWGAGQGASAQAALATSLTDVWHKDGQDGRETRRHIGVVAADMDLVRAFQRVNATRTGFHGSVMQLRRDDPGAWSALSGQLVRRAPDVQQALRDAGLIRLHLKQMSRLVPVLTAMPVKISYSWYQSGRSIKRLHRDEVLARLEQLGERQAHLAWQYARVASLPASEWLAQVQSQAPLLRANVRFQDGSRKAFNVALPIVCPRPDEPARSLPEVIEPNATPPAQRERARRSDQKLEDEPFVPALRVYRYR